MRNVIARGRLAVGTVPAWRRAIYVDGTIGGIYAIIIGGTVQTGVILWAGGGPFDLGLLSALTTGGGLVVLLIRQIERRIRSHKQRTRLGWTLARASWLPLALFLASTALMGGAGRSLAVTLTLATVFLTAALAAVGNVSWYSWVARLIPATERGSFLAQRSRSVSFASLLLLPIVGLILDQGRAWRQEPLSFALVLALPALGAGIGWRLLGGVPPEIDPPPDGRSGAAGRRGEISPGRLAAYTAVWQIGVYFAAPFFQAYALERLGMSFSLLMNLQVLGQITSILSLGWWGRIIDRIGLRLPLGVCSLAKAVIPLAYLISSPGVWWPVAGVYLLSVLDAGINTANGAAYAQISAGRHGSARVAHLNLVISICASITPVAAGLALAQIHLPGIDLLVVLFLLSALGRAASGLILLLPGRPRRARPRRPVPGVEPA